MKTRPNPRTRQLHNLGQSRWIDNIRRERREMGTPAR